MIEKVKKIISANFIFPKMELNRSEDLNGVVVVVTGGSRGIGKAVVEMLLSQGAFVAAISRSIKDLEEAFGESKNLSLLLLEADVRLEESVKGAITAAKNRFGKIDVLINNAGVNVEGPLDQISLADFNSVVETNLTGAFLTCKAVLPDMKRLASGLIINIGSKISHNTNVAPNKVIYATAKAAVESFSFALNKELKEFGVRVVCLMPGTVNTFVSTSAKKFMSPYEVADLVQMIIKLKTIDFEGIIFKSVNQDI